MKIPDPTQMHQSPRILMILMSIQGLVQPSLALGVTGGAMAGTLDGPKPDPFSPLHYSRFDAPGMLPGPLNESQYDRQYGQQTGPQPDLQPDPQYDHQADTLAARVFYTDSGKAEFTSSVPLHEFTGESDHLTGMIDLSTGLVDFYLDVNTLKTGNSRRDRDMYQTLSSDDNPFAEFTGQLLDSIDTAVQGPQTVRVRGEMSIHGVSQDLEVEGTVQLDGEQLHLQAGWVLNITHYDIEPPGILFYRVRDEMGVRINAALNRGAPPAEQESPPPRPL